MTKWRRRFATHRIDGLSDAPRPGAERTIGDHVIEAVLVDTMKATTSGDTHCSTRSLAARYGISKTTVAEIWRSFGLQPWKQDSYMLSRDPEVIDKARDLVGLYLLPPDAAAVFAVDERLGTEVPGHRAQPESSAAVRATDSDRHHGNARLVAALGVACSIICSEARPGHTQDDFISFLNKINREVPGRLDVHVIVDNLSMPKAPKVQRWLLRHRRFHLHFSAAYRSWMSLVDRWLSALTTKGSHQPASAKQLATDIEEWTKTWGERLEPFAWQKTAEQILGIGAGAGLSDA